MTFVRFAIAAASTMFAACNASSAAPRADAAVVDAAAAPIVDEAAPAKLAFVVKPGRSLVGHTRASWPLDLPEMPWVANTFVNMSLDSYDGRAVVGTVEMYAAPGLDARTCTVEVLWNTHAKNGVQLRGAPAIKNLDPHVGTHATWRFRTRIPGTPPAAKGTAFAFCPNDVMFYSIEMIAPGPQIRAAYCKELRRDREGFSVGKPVLRGKTFDMQFACGTLPRLKGRTLVDECRGDTLLTIDALGKDVTAFAPAAGTGPTDEELRRWYGGSTSCARVKLSSPTEFAASANKPFAAFVKRAGARLRSALSRDGMIQP